MRYKVKAFRSKSVKKRRHHFWQLKNHPLAVPVAVFSALITLSIVGYFSLGRDSLLPDDSRVVIVTYDRQQRIVPTKAPDVATLLKRLDIDLHEGDVVEPSLETPIVEDNFRVNVYRARPVTIVDGSRTFTAFNAASTPRSMANQAGVTLYPEDIIEVKPVENVLKEGIGQKVVVDRATPANVNVYGTPVAVRTHAETVGELLKEKNIQLASDDTVSPAIDAILTPETQVFVTRNGVQIATVEETLSAETRTIEDATLSFGSTAVRQEGSDGKKIVTYEIQLQNGVEVGRRVIQEVIAAPAVPRVVARGKAISIPEDKSSLLAAAGIAESDFAYVNYIFSRESTWRPNAVNANGCIGLGQRCPSGGVNALAVACPNWETDVICQIQHFTSYAVGRYGSWQNAYEAWIVKRWW